MPLETHPNRETNFYTERHSQHKGHRTLFRLMTPLKHYKRLFFHKLILSYE